MGSQPLPLLFDVRFNAYPRVHGGDLRCSKRVPPKPDEGLFWHDPVSEKPGLWLIQRVEYYLAHGHPPDGMPKTSRADGALWLNRIAGMENEKAQTDDTRPRAPWRRR